jgi:ribosomal protein S7
MLGLEHRLGQQFLLQRELGIPVLTTWHGHVSNSSFLKKIYNSIMLKGDAVIANSILYR